MLSGLMSVKIMQLICYGICIHQFSTQMNTFGTNMTPPTLTLTHHSDSQQHQSRLEAEIK